jgi:hypothetical protein
MGALAELGCFGSAGGCGDVFEVESVPISADKEMQVGAAADRLRLVGQGLAVWQDEPVLACDMEVFAGEGADSQPVPVWSIAAEQGNAGACGGQRQEARPNVTAASLTMGAAAHRLEPSLGNRAGAAA